MRNFEAHNGPQCFRKRSDMDFGGQPTAPNVSPATDSSPNSDEMYARAVHAEQDYKQLRARMAASLDVDGRIGMNVAIADEALSSNPPHVEVAREKIRYVLSSLAQQVSELRS